MPPCENRGEDARTSKFSLDPLLHFLWLECCISVEPAADFAVFSDFGLTKVRAAAELECHGKVH